MRPQDEIQRAHRRLMAALSAAPVNPYVRARINAYADALCWVLDETHDYEFGRDLAELGDASREQRSKGAGSWDIVAEGNRRYAMFRRFQEDQEEEMDLALHSVRRQILGKLEAQLGAHQPATDDPQPTNHFGHRGRNESDSPLGPSSGREPGRDSESSVAISDVESSKLRVERPH